MIHYYSYRPALIDRARDQMFGENEPMEIFLNNSSFLIDANKFLIYLKHKQKKNELNLGIQVICESVH